MATGLHKAAVILMSLPEDLATSVLSKLNSTEVEQVSIEIAQTGRLTPEEQESTIHEFAAANPKALGGALGSLELARNLVQKALGDGASNTLDNLQQSIEALPFGFLKKVDPQNLLTFIVDEHPQTIALILSHLPSNYGAQVIGGLPTDKQLSVIRRVATMGQTNPTMIKQVEEGLSSRMASVVSQSFEDAGGVDRVAEILNVTDRTTEKALLENLTQEDPELVEEIRRLMFVFEDLMKLTDKDIQALLKNVETSQWAMALKGCNEDLKDKVLGNMSQRAAEMLREEGEFMGPVRQSEVEGVQQQIVDIVRKLEDAGEITVASGGDGGDVFVT